MAGNFGYDVQLISDATATVKAKNQEFNPITSLKFTLYFLPLSINS